MATDATSLALRQLENDLQSFHLINYGGRVDGFLVTAKNSGTHWLRFMASHAIAHHLDLPPPAHSSGPGSDDFIGHPKHARVHPGAPRIGSSHHIPSRLIALAARGGLVSLPPTGVRVRDLRQALLSYYVKWRDAYGLGSLADYLRRPAPGTCGPAVRAPSQRLRPTREATYRSSEFFQSDKPEKHSIIFRIEISRDIREATP